MDKRDEIIDLAFKEVIDQTFPQTRRYLSIYHIKNEDKKYEMCLEQLKEDAWLVRFAIFNEGHDCFVIPVTQDASGLKLKAPFLEPYTKVLLKLFSQQLSHDELGRSIGLEPTRISNLDNGERTWEFEFEKPVSDSLLEQVHSLIQKLSPHKHQLAKVLQQPEVEGHIAIEYVGSPNDLSGLFLDKDSIAFLHQTGLELDIEIKHINKKITSNIFSHLSESSLPTSSPQTTPFANLPTIIAHADWGLRANKQWIAIAGLAQDNRYQTLELRRVGELSTFFSTLKSMAGPGGSVLIGFDFPFGLPSRYAHQAGITHFLDALQEFGQGTWSDFYDVASHPEQISTHRPFYPRSSGKKGEVSRQHLLDGLGVEDYKDLLRTCDGATSNRQAACAIFWTLGGNQVGKGAIVGWRDLIAPALKSPENNVAIWPFDGPLQDLIQPDAVVLAETYPAEFYHHLGLSFPKAKAGQKSGKRVQTDRIVNGERLLQWANANNVRVHEELKEALLDGFGASKDGEDPFDATVGLFGMLNVILGKQSPGEPQEEAIRHLEGWILGLQKENLK